MLSAYRVVELSSEATQMCGHLLAELGADVICVEPPGGSEARTLPPFLGGTPGPSASTWWHAFNRRKRSVLLDLTLAEGRADLERLVASADVLVEGMAPGELAALGLGYDALSQINPGIVVASITWFGQTGPKAGQAGSDLVALAASGTLSTWGYPDRAPVRLSIPQAMLHAGADAAVACLVALFERHTSGRGQHIDASAQASATLLGCGHPLSGFWHDQGFERSGSGLRFGPVDVRMIYECRDGYIAGGLGFGSAIGAATMRLLTLVHSEGFCDEATRDKDWMAYVNLLMDGTEPMSELTRVQECIARFFAAHTKSEVYEFVRQHDLLFSPVNTVEDLLADEQLNARGYWRESVLPGVGAVQVPGPIAHFGDFCLPDPGRGPAIGEHQLEVFSELDQNRERRD